MVHKGRQIRKRVFVISTRKDLKEFKFVQHEIKDSVMPSIGINIPQPPNLKSAIKDRFYCSYIMFNRFSDNKIYTITKGAGCSMVYNMSKYIHNGIVYGLTAKDICLQMGLTVEHYEKFKSAGLSDNKIASLCGNSIVVNVLDYIFNQINEQGII